MKLIYYWFAAFLRADRRAFLYCFLLLPAKRRGLTPYCYALRTVRHGASVL